MENPPQQAALDAIMAAERERLLQFARDMHPEPDHVPDEEHTPHAPEKKRRGRPRKSQTTPAPQPKPPAIPRAPTQTLVSKLNIPVQFIYLGGTQAGQQRQAVIISACGSIQPDGGYNITTLRCVCGTSKAWKAFRLDRMLHLTDMRTGEVIADPKAWITSIVNRIA